MRLRHAYAAAAELAKLRITIYAKVRKERSCRSHFPVELLPERLSDLRREIEVF